jgi:hypothetical protein
MPRHEPVSMRLPAMPLKIPQIILDKITGLIKEKTTTIESNGNTEAMGGNTPVTSKTTIVIQVKPE